MTTPWVDEPISGSAEDRLGRLEYARHVASLIADTHRPKASVVYGLSGPWGSGKTSLSNMIVEQLLLRPGGWRLARFTPWATSDVNGMLAEFYRSIAHALPERRGAKKARQALGLVAQVAAPMAEAIPVAGDATSALIKKSTEMLLESPPWDVAFQKATKRLIELGVPVLVVVDDIDRLHPEELTALLKVVRLLGRFPGVDYLLAYDNSTVFDALASTTPSGRDGTPERFMEKIVQFPVVVPPLLQGQQLRLLNEGFSKAFAATGRTDSEDGRLSSLLSSFVGLLTTPRAIDRYVAQVQHQMSMLPGEEIDDTDLLILTLIRVALPSVFELLPRHRGRLLSGFTDRFAEPAKRRGGEHFERFDVQTLLTDVPSELREITTELILSLFPKVKGPDRPVVTRGRSAQAISVDAYFNRYFSMSIADEDLSDVALQRAVTDAAQNDDAALGSMLDTDDPDKLLLVLGKVRVVLDTTSERPAALLNVAGLLADRLVAFADPPHMMFSPQDLCAYILADVLTRVGSELTAEQIEDLLSRISSKALRLRVWSHVGSEVKRSSDPQPWFETVNGRMADEAVTDFVNNLRDGDSAAIDDGTVFGLHFALSNGRETELRAQVQQLLSTGGTDIGSLAARFVSLRRLMNIGAAWRLADEVDQETFDRVAPLGDDPFYHLSPVPFAGDDFSWANRRLAATGHLRPPRDRSTPAPES